MEKTIRTNNYVYTIVVDDNDKVAQGEIDAAIETGQYFIAGNQKMIAFPTMACVYPYVAAEIDYYADWVNMLKQEYPTTLEGMLKFCTDNISHFSELTPAQGGAIAGSFLIPFSEITDNGPVIKWVWNYQLLGELWKVQNNIRNTKAFLREILLNIETRVY